MRENLGSMKIFEGISEQDLETLLQCLRAFERRCRKGEVILKEGEPTEWLGVVLSGRAIIASDDVWGNHSILGSAPPGAVVAEAYACIPGEPLRITVTAAEDTEVLFLNAGKAAASCSCACPFHARLAQNLLSVCARKSLELSRRILHTSSKSIRGRLLSYFSECAKKSGSCSFRVPYSRQQLADYLSVDRSAMCGELSKMQKDGLIRYSRNDITILAAHML